MTSNRGKSNFFVTQFQKMVGRAPLFQYFDHEIGFENSDPCDHIYTSLEKNIRGHACSWSDDSCAFFITNERKNRIDGMIHNSGSGHDHYFGFFKGKRHFRFWLSSDSTINWDRALSVATPMALFRTLGSKTDNSKIRKRFSFWDKYFHLDFEMICSMFEGK